MHADLSIALTSAEHFCTAQLAISYTAKSIALLREEEIAVGAEDGKIHIYALKGSALTEVRTQQATCMLR